MNNFFTELEAITDKIELQFTIKSAGGVMSVLVMPKAAVNDPAFGKIKPIRLSGTATDLDADFFTTVKQPLEFTAGIVSNIAEYETSAKQAAGQTTQAKAEQLAAQNKKESDRKEGKRQSDIAETAVKEKDYPKALKALAIVLELAENKEPVKKLIKEVEALSGKGSLFGAANVEEEEEPSAAQTNEQQDEAEPAPKDIQEEQMPDDIDEDDQIEE